MMLLPRDKRFFAITDFLFKAIKTLQYVKLTN